MATATDARPAAAPGGPRPNRNGISERGLARLFISPSITAMAIVALFPILYAVVLSFYEYVGLQQGGFTALGNYVDALTDGRFWDSVIATFVFTVFSVTFEFLIGMGFALIMHQAFVGRGVARATILIPWVIPTVIAAQMWRYMFEVTPGFINWALPFVPDDFNWLGSSGWAMFTIIFADVWKTAPFVALLLLAGLQTIPEEVYEAGRVDGASAWQRFTRITLPLLRPAILVAMLFRTTDALRIYDLPAVMTRGAFGTETLSVLVQDFVIATPNPGFASTLSVLTFILVLGVGVLLVSVLGKELVLGDEA